MSFVGCLNCWSELMVAYGPHKRVRIGPGHEVCLVIEMCGKTNMASGWNSVTSHGYNFPIKTKLAILRF